MTFLQMVCSDFSPVGHPQQNPVELHAPQAWFDAPLLLQRSGFANDWLTNWTDSQAVVRSGRRDRGPVRRSAGVQLSF
ncbi:MAG: hypothetical protein R3C49_24850 [Planctomycetaceae bacterium]